ncbi:inheritance of peroxisomes protein 1-domain-containing protein [Boeremia exigua]|uniref:inheritance of peroxisomes protein 1-domain-containing protein n=1 Tax=Boeremia exigua TaxID=749465 RepID=UPI001E8E2133|nr:inheritance of peroxisomes protein 1-domain-containing protein [Boeremia exigua]KAH6644058.1 inheritance of peroxisomes protein 1-domain-containing protein [Boeremia exigua]
MSSPLAPSRTPEHAPPPLHHGRRSFTVPARLRSSPAPAAASTNSADGIETLVVCPHSRIVSFASAGVSATSGGNHVAWKTPTERTLAVGVLRIYRVTASNVSFLNSGNLLHTIFPRSQCWCVDGQSVFVLRIRQDSYYRMELPFDTDEDKAKIEQFKSVLSQVLQYEKTQCPFTRSFEADLPERPKTPPRKRPSQRPTQKAKKWILDKTWMPEDGPRPSTPLQEGSESANTSSYEEDDRSSIHTDASDVPIPETPGTVFENTPPPKAPRRLSVAERAQLFQSPRSVTAPIHATRDRSLSSVSMMGCIPEISKHEEKNNVQEISTRPVVTERKPSTDAASLLSSTDSFYSFHTARRSPSPPFLDAEVEILNPWATSLPKQDNTRGRARHRRDLSELTVRATSTDHAEKSAALASVAPLQPITTPLIDVRPSSAPHTPPLVSDSDEDSLGQPSLDVPTPPDMIRMRKLTGASPRRAFSPMPQPQNLCFPTRQKPDQKFATALVRKTCEIVLGPPQHLVSLMLRIAASISKGFRFSTYRVRRTNNIPGSWESSGEEDEWEEDDFGIPLSNLGELGRRTGFPGELD